MTLTHPRGTRRRGAALAVGVVLVALLAALAAPAHAVTRTQLINRATDLNFEVTMSKFLQVKNNAKSTVDSKFAWADDGCSAPADWATAYWQGVFRNPCKRHDFGYRNFGKGLQLVSTGDQKARIDSKFREDMMSRCSRFSSESEIDDCRGAADAFYYALRASGKSWTAFTGKRCIKGKFCIFDDKSYEDRRAAMTVSHSNLNDDGLGFGDKTSSAKNADNVAWVLYDDTGYSDRRLCFKPGATLADFDRHTFEDKASSVKKMSGTGCPSGSIVIS